MVWDLNDTSFGFLPFDLFAISYYEPLVGLVHPGHIAPLWLRTCYDPALATGYEELERAADPGGFLEDRVLDNGALYAFEFADSPDSWRRILIRIPAFTEFLGARPLDEDGSNFIYHSGLHDDELLEQIEAMPDESLREISRISRRVQAVLYLVDREAITARQIKVLWLDEHGMAVWDNRIEPSGLEDLTLSLQGAVQFDEIVEEAGNRGDLLMI
ncbi:hypothetical protein BDW69DRAFT_180198 [Aspergillus filifer]